MDPLSVLSGIAGVAAAGAALSSALFEIIESARDAPKDMATIARSIMDLSLVLSEMRRVLKRGRWLYRDRLLRGILSTMRRIDGVHDEIHGLIAGDRRMARVLWAFRRKSKTAALLTQIESLKSTLQLMATTLTLAIKQRQAQHSADDPDREDSALDRAGLRAGAENLVRAVGQSVADLDTAPQRQSRSAGTQTETRFSRSLDDLSIPSRSDDFLAVHRDRAKLDYVERRSRPEYADDAEYERRKVRGPPTVYLDDPWEEPFESETQLQERGPSPNDTATWLRTLVFGGEVSRSPSPLRMERSRSDDPRLSRQELAPQPRLRHSSNVSLSAPSPSVVDKLLLSWTNLSDAEIEATQGLEDRLLPWTADPRDHASKLSVAEGSATSAPIAVPVVVQGSSSYAPPDIQYSYVRPPTSYASTGTSPSASAAKVQETKTFTPADIKYADLKYSEVPPAVAENPALARIERIYTRFGDLRLRCDRFIRKPPADLARAQKKHRELSELVLQTVLLPIDEIDVKGDPDARARRRAIVLDVQTVLTQLDHVLDLERADDISRWKSR
ncbi:hypothetical protein B0T26DRAFT_677987 [Lasiosphaeria miniovina]|uniref:BAG domain-containing protein n=1 Tax=Lasiosphaeria miniovina TaxID=1954250 RepID=A0AA40AD68_9PEZI|nr:uncharacterized protein B0T26DRAFT_677987 [Lasiosphaeria miniovina]KAK0713681.1 hypothetical protein B0T26DRAFT_677987 [Lasiosphaeria miniovina]